MGKCSSKCSSAFSQPALLEGFALRSRKPLSVLSSSDPSGKVTVLLVRGPDSFATLIHTDITNMAQENLSSVDSLFSLVESMDFDSQMEDLMTEAELVANLPEDFFSTDPIPVHPSETPTPSLPPQMPPPSPPSDESRITEINEEMVARLRCTVMEVVTGKRKRGGEEEEEESDE